MRPCGAKQLEPGTNGTKGEQPAQRYLETELDQRRRARTTRRSAKQREGDDFRRVPQEDFLRRVVRALRVSAKGSAMDRGSFNSSGESGRSKTTGPSFPGRFLYATKRLHSIPAGD